MNFRNKMLISLRNNVQKNILKYKLFAVIESQVDYEVLVELEYTKSISTAPSLIVDKCWSYEF